MDITSSEDDPSILLREKLITALLCKIENTLRGSQVVALIDIERGSIHKSIGSLSLDTHYHDFLEKGKLALKLESIHLTDKKDQINDILIYSQNMIHIFKPTASGQYVIYISGMSKKINLGMARSVLKNNILEVDEILT